MGYRSWLASGLLVAAGAAPAAAEVIRSTPDDFTVSRSVSLAVPPEAAWQALVRPGAWWSDEHSWSGNAETMTIEPRAGGCFCEALAGGGSVEHMRVIYAAPGAQLRMVGVLGPMQTEALAGTMTVTLEPAGEGTTLTWTYKVGGSSELPLETIAPAVDGVVGEQFERLAAHLAASR